MATPAQTAANQQNALKSTGPATDIGKARSAQNSRTHGLTAMCLPVDPHDRTVVEGLIQSLEQLHQPADAIQSDLVRQLAMARWNQMCAEQLQSGYWDIAKTPDFEKPRRPTDRSRARAMAQALIDDCGKNVFPKILRYQSAAIRNFEKAEKSLQTLRAQPAPQPVETNPIPPPAEEEITIDDIKGMLPAETFTDEWYAALSKGEVSLPGPGEILQYARSRRRGSR